MFANRKKAMGQSQRYLHKANHRAQHKAKHKLWKWSFRVAYGTPALSPGRHCHKTALPRWQQWQTSCTTCYWAASSTANQLIRSHRGPPLKAQ
jgi:hypothetical protein